VLMAVDPIHQFRIVDLFPVVKIGNTEIAFTNSAAFMMLAVAGITVFLVGATAKRGLVPSRLQSAAEISYEFVASTVRGTAGAEGMKFFPFVFSLFMFILTVNMIGMIPYTFTVTSHIIVTAALAITVFLTVLGYGLWRHGLHFFNLFVPKGVPIYILPLIVAIEILSFVSRPISHSVRLFANMLAGHITLQVFASFIILLGTGLGVVGWIGGALPFLMIVILMALEALVAFLQAYVFAILTCIYLNDAIHPGH
jgi:F-type H+-transporting ATPase subunit a